jgi:hypothetical protein
MLKGGNARLKDLITLWGNITYLKNHDMQKLIVYFTMREDILLQIWLLIK